MRGAGSARAARGARVDDRGQGLELHASTTTHYAPRIHDQGQAQRPRPACPLRSAHLSCTVPLLWIIKGLRVLREVEAGLLHRPR